MGNYGALVIGTLDVGEWKNHVPLELALLFAAEDAKRKWPKKEGDDAFFGLVTTAKKARERMNSRGITMPFCRKFYEQFKSDELYDFNSEAGEGRYLPNRVKFEDYLEYAKEALKYGGPALWIENDEDFDKSAAAQKRPPSDWLMDEVEFFDDAYFCFRARMILEVAPDDMRVSADLTELWYENRYSWGTPADHLEKMSRLLERRVHLNYELYGFVVENDPRLEERLTARLQSMNEDTLIGTVILPLLNRMGFEDVRQVNSHGREEFGRDVLPFRKLSPFGTVEYAAVQAKAVDIHGTASRPGNAVEIISQARQALDVSFIDTMDNERKRLDKFIVIASGRITPSARRIIEDAFEGDRRLILIGVEKLVGLLREYRLHQFLLFADLPSKTMAKKLKPKRRAR